MSTASLIREVSNDLNDQEPGYEYTRWPYEQLLSYAEEGAQNAADSLRSLFIEHVVVPLTANTLWHEACQCTDILRILGECTKDGRVTKRLRRRADIEENEWPGESWYCPSNDNGLESYTISDTYDNMFAIYPVVSPADKKTHYVLVECYIKPDLTDGSYEMPGEVVGLVKQWMLFRALMMDSENNSTIVALAKQHLEAYQLLLTSMLVREKQKEEEAKTHGVIRPVPNGSNQ